MEKSSFPVRNGLRHSQPAKLEWNVVKCETLWNNTPTNSNIAFPKYCYLPDVSILIKKRFLEKSIFMVRCQLFFVNLFQPL